MSTYGFDIKMSKEALEQLDKLRNMILDGYSPAEEILKGVPYVYNTYRETLVGRQITCEEGYGTVTGVTPNGYWLDISEEEQEIHSFIVIYARTKTI